MKIFSFILVLICFSLFNSPANAQELVDGERLGNILIGKSTIYDVINTYGQNYKLKKNTDYSNVLFYEKLGLAFYSCQADPKQEIFVILMQAPFKVTTEKGIELGKSNLGNLYRKYGRWRETSSGYEYEETGMYFITQKEFWTDFEEDNKNFAQAKVTNLAKNSIENVVENSLSDENAINSTNNEISENKTNIQTNNQNINSSINNSININSNNNQNSSLNNSSKERKEKDEFLSDLKKVKNKVIQQIELIEKGELRQCGSF